MTRSPAGLRRAPYALLFPLGVVLSWAGVGHWLATALGAGDAFRTIFHAMAQIQGFLTAFAVGFLYTAIPRRTGTPPPSAFELAAGALLPVATVVAAWFRAWAVSQVFWLAAVGVVARFVVIRFRARDAARRPPASFVWVPVSLGFGAVGSILTGVYGATGGAWPSLHALGKLLVLQGMFLGLIVGVGGMVIPLITRGETPADLPRGAVGRALAGAHLLAALVLALTFLVEATLDPRPAVGMRAVVVGALLIGVARIHRPPTRPGWHRRLVWVAAWALPVGYAFAAAFPEQMSAAMHVVYVGGFGLMTFAVGAHVILAHGGRDDLVFGRPAAVPLFAAAWAVALVARVGAGFAGAAYLTWIGVAAGAFLAASAAWFALVIPGLVGLRKSLNGNTLTRSGAPDGPRRPGAA